MQEEIPVPLIRYTKFFKITGEACRAIGDKTMSKDKREVQAFCEGLLLGIGF